MPPKPRSKPVSLTQDYLKSILHYNPDTGLFVWLQNIGTRAKVGAIAGSKNNEGYLHIKINKIRYKSHRLAWLYMTGSFPTKNLDHINNIRDDNKWSNLRECTVSQNNYNYKVKTTNKLGVKGVYLYKGLYRAQIQINKEKIFLGAFKTLTEAKNAHDEAAIKYQGDFVNYTIEHSNDK